MNPTHPPTHDNRPKASELRCLACGSDRLRVALPCDGDSRTECGACGAAATLRDLSDAARKGAVPYDRELLTVYEEMRRDPVARAELNQEHALIDLSIVLAAAVKASGRSRADVAADAGIGAALLTLYLRNEAAPTVRQAADICSALGLRLKFSVEPEAPIK